MAVEKEQGLSKKQMYNAYQNYLSRYTRQADKMIRRGTYMHDDKLTYSEYKMVRRAKIEQMKDEGKRLININQTIVSEQQYEFSMAQAKGLRSAGQELGLGFADESLMKLRGGRDLRNEDLSLINSALKEKYPELSGIQRAEWIKENIFGGSE